MTATANQFLYEYDSFTEGVITDFERAYTTSRYSGNSYRMIYSYEIDGISYASKIYKNDGILVGAKFKGLVPIGSKLEVFYDKKHPYISIAKRSTNIEVLWHLIYSLSLIIVISVIGSIRVRK
jgi:hypothetical protein